MTSKEFKEHLQRIVRIDFANISKYQDKKNSNYYFALEKACIDYIENACFKKSLSEKEAHVLLLKEIQKILEYRLSVLKEEK